MTEVAEKESTELVTVPPKETALEVFVSKQGLEPYLQTIRQQLDQFLAAAPALDTKKGRDAYASMAFKIARSKTALDNVGKELVADLKEKPKKVDASRKAMRDKLDAWRDEARGPLNEWEAAEEARKARHNDRIEHIRSFEEFDGLLAAGLEVQLANLEDIAVDDSLEEYEAEAHRAKDKAVKVLRAAIEAQKAREAEQAGLERLRQEAAEREQKEREQRIAREAEERARREAEKIAQAEREAAARREQGAKAEAERKEREHQEAIAKAKRDAELAEQRAKEEYDRKERERIAEQQRQEQERLDAERREQEEVARRQADKKHRGRINRTAMQAFIDGGMPPECAKQAVTMLAKGEIPNATINY